MRKAHRNVFAAFQRPHAFLPVDFVLEAAVNDRGEIAAARRLDANFYALALDIDFDLCRKKQRNERSKINNWLPVGCKPVTCFRQKNKSTATPGWTHVLKLCEYFWAELGMVKTRVVESEVFGWRRSRIFLSDSGSLNWIIFYITLPIWEFLLKWYNIL